MSLALETTGTCHIDPRLISLKIEGPVLAGLACSQVGFGFGFSCLEQRELDLDRQLDLSPQQKLAYVSLSVSGHIFPEEDNVNL